MTLMVNGGAWADTIFDEIVELAVDSDENAPAGTSGLIALRAGTPPNAFRPADEAKNSKPKR